MEILVAKGAGFCFGVKRAIDIAFQVAEGHTSAVTFGPIIHNPQVINKLREKGITAVEEIPGSDTTIIVRTHGIERSLHEELKASGHPVIDATCPFVKKAQQYAKLLAEEGYQVLILGDSNHPEVKGIVSFAGDNVVVVSESDTLPVLNSKVGIVVQTTQPIEALKKLIVKAVEQAKELKVYNTICNSTALRLRETETVASRSDVVLVVGGKNSANTTQLTRLSESLGVKTYHIETADEIEAGWFDGVGTVGITAGASTPEWIIEEVIGKIEHIGGRIGNGS